VRGCSGKVRLAVNGVKILPLGVHRTHTCGSSETTTRNIKNKNVCVATLTPTPARQDLRGKTRVFRTPDLPEQHLRVTRSDDHP
jgi:hypothetical protein